MSKKDTLRSLGLAAVLLMAAVSVSCSVSAGHPTLEVVSVSWSGNTATVGVHNHDGETVSARVQVTAALVSGGRESILSDSFRVPAGTTSIVAVGFSDLVASVRGSAPLP